MYRSASSVNILLSDAETVRKRYQNNEVGPPYVKLRLYISDIKSTTCSLIRNAVASLQLVPTVTNFRILFACKLHFFCSLFD